MGLSVRLASARGMCGCGGVSRGHTACAADGAAGRDGFIGARAMRVHYSVPG
jgi:hypothetical protein